MRIGTMTPFSCHHSYHTHPIPLCSPRCTTGVEKDLVPQTHSSSVTPHLLNSMGGSSTGSTSSSSPSSLQAARKVRVASLAEYLTCGPALAPVRQPHGQAMPRNRPNQGCICYTLTRGCIRMRQPCLRTAFT